MRVWFPITLDSLSVLNIHLLSYSNNNNKTSSEKHSAKEKKFFLPNVWFSLVMIIIEWTKKQQHLNINSETENNELSFSFNFLHRKENMPKNICLPFSIQFIIYDCYLWFFCVLHFVGANSNSILILIHWQFVCLFGMDGISKR